MPEAHGEALHQPAARPGCRGGGDQPRHEQCEHRHESIRQGVDTVEDDREGAGKQARPDAEQRQQNRDGNREFQQGLFCHDTCSTFKTGPAFTGGFCFSSNRENA